ncbi:MAG: phosphoglycerate dehydrogenase [Candidatus Korobacteraceae bacterium]|jgi:D-3-phosphoglycerate dehydrogenase
MKKVLLTTPTFGRYSKAALEFLRDGGLEIVRTPQGVGVAKEAEVLAGIDDDTVAIITGLEPITKKVIDSARSLKVVAKHGIGVDNIDLNAAKERGVRVVNAPGTNSEAVADLTVGFMFALARKIIEANAKLRAGEWPRVMGTSVWGTTVGIVGLGMIGKAVARRTRGLNMTTLAYDPYFDEQFAAANQVRKASLDEILSTADFVTIHIPYSEETKNLIGKEQLAKMKPSAFLVNAARGGIVDEAALYDALAGNRIAGAAIDVFAKEPPAGSPLLTLPNTILTPHMGAYTEEALKLTSEFAARTVLEVLSGKRPSCTIV